MPLKHSPSSSSKKTEFINEGGRNIGKVNPNPSLGGISVSDDIV